MPCPLEIENVLGSHFDYHVFIELCSLNLLQAPIFTHIYPSVLYIFVFFLCLGISSDLSLGVRWIGVSA